MRHPIFGEMQFSTPKEQQEYEEMLNKHSIFLGMSIFDMSTEIEIGTCSICGKEHIQVNRKYYRYDIPCECCVGEHFEIVWYCKDCTPKPPYRISAIVKPI